MLWGYLQFLSGTVQDYTQLLHNQCYFCAALIVDQIVGNFMFLLSLVAVPFYFRLMEPLVLCLCCVFDSFVC